MAQRPTCAAAGSDAAAAAAQALSRAAARDALEEGSTGPPAWGSMRARTCG